MNDILYTSPSGAEFKAELETWEESFSHATTAFPLANGMGDKYQDNGLYSSTFKIRFVFTNDNDSDSFYSAIRELGKGSLTDPRSKLIRTVQPISIVKRIGIKKDIKRTIFNVDFAQSIDEESIVPVVSLRKENNILSENAMNITAENFGDRQKINSVLDSVSQQNNFSDTLEKINKNISADVSALESNIDSIIQDPINTMISAKRLMELPGNSFSRVSDKISGYASLIDDLLENLISEKINTQTTLENDAHYIQSIGSMALNAMSNNLIDVSYNSKSEALAAVGLLIQKYEKYRDVLDSYQQSGYFVQDGATQQAISEYIYKSVGLLYQIVFSLKTEYKFEAPRLMSICEIASEYYADQWKEDEETLFDFIYETNNFESDGIILINPGAEITVYV